MPIDKDKIAKLLTERGAVKPCHRCGHSNFFVLDSYSYFNLQDNMSQGLVIGGPSVPFTMVACGNCGAITPHALGALGLLENPEKG
jgi:hypothetical protein